MRSTRELLRLSQAFTDEDPRQSWSSLLITLGLLLAVLAGAALLQPLLARAACSLLAGLLLVRLFVIFHDCQHHAIFRESATGRLLLKCVGLAMLTPPSYWNYLHNYHHRCNSLLATSGIGSYPVMTVSEYRMAAPLARLRYRWLRSPLSVLLAYPCMFLYGFCLRSACKDPLRHCDSVVALVLHAVVLLMLARQGWAPLIFVCVVPLLISLSLGGYLFYVQHNFPGVKLRPRQQWEYGFAAIHSSSYLEGSRLFHWLTGNIGFHQVHHLNSKIPFYRLPEAMNAIPELQAVGRTSLRISDIWACFGIHLWDPDLEQLVGFRQASTQTGVESAG